LVIEQENAEGQLDGWRNAKLPHFPIILTPATLHRLHSCTSPSKTTMSSRIDEETPLLHSQPAKSTPLPWGQFSIILFVQLAEPLTSHVIYPFAPQVSIHVKRRDRFWTLPIPLAYSRHRCHEGRRNQGRILCRAIGTSSFQTNPVVLTLFTLPSNLSSS